MRTPGGRGSVKGMDSGRTLATVRVAGEVPRAEAMVAHLDRTPSAKMAEKTPAKGLFLRVVVIWVTTSSSLGFGVSQSERT